MATAMDLEKLAQSVKSGQHVLKQHDSKKSKSKCWQTFRDCFFLLHLALLFHSVYILSGSGRVGSPGQVLPGRVTGQLV